MTRTMLALVALLLGSLPAKAQVLALSCDGEAKGLGTEDKPLAFTKMGLVVNLQDRVVTFLGIPARITETNAVRISFKGQNDVGFSVSGYIDRVTGTLFAETSTIDPKTGQLDLRPPGGPALWNLNCRTVRPLF
jgi:hypothetical protein